MAEAQRLRPTRSTALAPRSSTAAWSTPTRATALTLLALTTVWATQTRADEAPAVAGTATEIAADEITLELIMSDPDWIGATPANPYWADDGQAIYFDRKQPGERVQDRVRLDLKGGEQTVIEDAERGVTDVSGGVLSRDRQRKVYARHGDIYVKDLASGEIRQLTRSSAEETEPRFLVDDRSVFFRRGNGLFVRDAATALEIQWVDLRLTEDPAEKDENDDFLSRQQLRLFDYLQQQKHDRETARARAEAERAADPTRPRPPFYLGDEIEIQQAHLS
ncbi:MAG: hypothetical protein AAF657_40580, partial [Acidobacteriota bacterium]